MKWMQSVERLFMGVPNTVVVMSAILLVTYGGAALFRGMSLSAYFDRLEPFKWLLFGLFILAAYLRGLEAEWKRDGLGAFGWSDLWHGLRDIGIDIAQWVKTIYAKLVVPADVEKITEKYASARKEAFEEAMELRKQAMELEKLRIQHGAYFKWNDFAKHMIFGVTTILAISMFLIFLIATGILIAFSNIANKVSDTGVASTVDFEIEGVMNGYYHTKEFRSLRNVNPTCIEKYDYIEYIYDAGIAPLPLTVNEQLERLRDDNYVEYARRVEPEGTNITNVLFKRSKNNCAKESVIDEVVVRGFVPMNMTVTRVKGVGEIDARGVVVQILINAFREEINSLIEKFQYILSENEEMDDARMVLTRK